MSRSFLVPEPLSNYIESTFLHEHQVLRKLREDTAQMSNAGMQIGPDQGAFMALLAKATGARTYLEVGVFTGYSSTAMALALPDDGQIVACDVSEEFTARARQAWKEAGVESKIDLRIAPALETLEQLKAEGRSFDIAFIDADKPNYLHYYELVVTLVRKGGLVMIDNVLWDGRVADLDVNDESTQMIRQVNARAGSDERVEAVLVPIGDGLTIARVR